MLSTIMTIGEVVSDEFLKPIAQQMQEHVATIPGVLGHSILVEDGGRMVILITHWSNREKCLTYHASRMYRQLVASTQHMLLGSYVVKLFASETASGSTSL